MSLLRTILRRGFYVAAAVSSLLLLATLILWPVSYFHYIGVADYVIQDSSFCCRCHEGRLIFDRGEPISIFTTHSPIYYSRPPDRTPIKWSYLTWNSTSKNDWFPVTTTLGVSWDYLSIIHAVDVSIPFSYLTLLLSILPLLALRSIRRRRKEARAKRLGLCPNCNYDLRAQHAGTAGTVCPECGTPVAGRGPSPGGGGRP